MPLLSSLSYPLVRHIRHVNTHFRSKRHEERFGLSGERQQVVSWDSIGRSHHVMSGTDWWNALELEVGERKRPTCGARCRIGG